MEKMIELVYAFCKTSFSRKLKQHKYRVKVSGTDYKAVCSKKCANQLQITKQEVSCLNCHRLFLKILAEIKRSPQHFCSRSCSAIFHNQDRKINQLKTKEIVCRYCPT